jgi:hypothetical protein
LPSIKISKEDSTRPGLEFVVQVTLVEVASLTGQSMPSIVILYKALFRTRPVPVNVTSSPPTTFPTLGLMAERTEEERPSYLTSFKG